MLLSKLLNIKNYWHDVCARSVMHFDSNMLLAVDLHYGWTSRVTSWPSPPRLFSTHSILWSVFCLSIFVVSPLMYKQVSSVSLLNPLFPTDLGGCYIYLFHRTLYVNVHFLPTTIVFTRQESAWWFSFFWINKCHFWTSSPLNDFRRMCFIGHEWCDSHWLAHFTRCNRK